MADGLRVMRTTVVPFGHAGLTHVRLLLLEDLRADQAHAEDKDSLTGLQTRTTFRRSLERVSRQRGGDAVTALFLISLGDFKKLNRAFGQISGDTVLRTLADRLQRLAGPNDCLGRSGSDEFALCRLDCRSDMETEAQRIALIMSEACHVGGNKITPLVRMGISVARGPFSAEDLLDQAQTALECVDAASGKRFAIYDPGMDTAVSERKALEVDLRNAASRRQLDLHYQAFADSHSCRIRGFEALMRWQHPERGFISPGVFIPLAEDNGLIVELGEWALRKACLDAADWPVTMSVAVNVSPTQLQPRFPEFVASCLGAAKLAPQRLELEITESVLLNMTDETMAVLKRLQALGIRLALDDFGTGYASLTYLQNFPFGKIKIDQSFIRQAQQNPDSLAIVRMVAALGKALGVPTTAEGVETEEQRIAMRDSGCTYCQGFLFGAGLPHDQIAAMLGRQRASIRKPAYR
jgi:diguanylate cyclase (GGDEF)-like protein